MVKRLFLIGALLAPLTVPAHEPAWIPPAPWGVNPCEHAGNSCPWDLHDIYDNLVEAQRRRDEPQVRHWTKALSIWHAFNPDYRRHLHSHN
ncbi:MAG: hypothetical protein OXS28_19280 [Gammaproteobacteria bacterium]|nr:hypothetical protein [Gammaproteobacteria bacterium]